MRPYTAILSARFRMLLQYRAAALAGIGTQLFFGLVRMMIFEAFYRSPSAGQQPMDAQQVTTYIWLGQAFLLLAMLHLDGDVATMIRTGAVAYEMVRPVDLYNLWLARAISNRTAPLMMRAAPILLISAAFGVLSPPASAESAALFAVSVALGIVLAAAFATLMTISLLWTISGEGIARLGPAIIFFFSGMVIPLPLLPAWAQPVLEALPFRGLIDVPFRIYMGHLSAQETLRSLAQQVAWVIALVALGRVLVARGTRRLVVQGG
jgi:ABC-2 type transport system permease protein